MALPNTALDGRFPVTLMGFDTSAGLNFVEVDSDGGVRTRNYVWDTGTLAWIPSTGGSGSPSSSVEVTNFPASYPVTDNGGSLTVDGSVSVSNFPSSYPITDNAGSITVDDGGSSLTIDGTVTAVDSGAGKTLKSASFSLSATGSVVTAVTSKRIKVFAVKLVCSAAISVNFRSGASTSLEGAQAIAANGGYVEAVNPPAFLFGTTAGESLDLVISGTGTAAGRVSYWDDDAS